MELGLDFEDEDLRKESKEKDQILTSYNAKICQPKWFLTAEGDDNESRSNISKLQADYYYGVQKYHLAASSYREGITALSRQNRVMRRDMMESLSRCYACLDERENALNLVEDLMADATTTDNMVQIMMLKQQILNKFSLLEAEIDVIRQLIEYHPYNVQFWLLLMNAYRRQLSDCDNAETVTINMSKYHSSDNSLNHDLDTKLQKTLTLTGSESQVKDHFNSYSNACNCCTEEKYQTEKLSSPADIMSGSHEDKRKHTRQWDKCETIQHNLNSPACTGVIVQQSSNTVSDAGQLEKKDYMCSIRNNKSSENTQNSNEKEVEQDRQDNRTPLAHLMLLTCCIRARLLLRSVHGTVGSFVKVRNQELLAQVEKEIEELHLEDSVVEAATEFMKRDLYQTNEETDDVDDTVSCPPSVKANSGSTKNFDEKWFAWIKNVRG